MKFHLKNSSSLRIKRNKDLAAKKKIIAISQRIFLVHTKTALLCAAFFIIVSIEGIVSNQHPAGSSLYAQTQTPNTVRDSVTKKQKITTKPIEKIENDVFWSYDALKLKMRKDIIDASEKDNAFSGKIALVSLTLYEGRLSQGEEKYLLKMIEELDYSHLDYYFVRSVKALSRTQINKDGNLVRNFSISSEKMAEYARELNAAYFAQIGVLKTGRRLQLTLTVFETETQVSVWSKRWSVLRDIKTTFLQLSFATTFDNYYPIEMNFYVGQNILNIGHFGLEMGLNYSFVNSNFEGINSHVQPGFRFGAVLAFSLVQSIVDDFEIVDFFFQVRPGFYGAYQVSRQYTPAAGDEGNFKSHFSVPIGFSLLIKDFFIIGTEVDIGNLITKRQIPFIVSPVVSFGFKF